MVVKEFMPVTDAKITIEKEVKRKPSIAELTTIEVPGKPTSATYLENYDKKGKKISRAKVPKVKSSKTKKETEERAVKKDSILVITEKPQAAQKIASALGDANKYTEDGVSYYELTRNGNLIRVASAVGHLFNLTYSKGQHGWPIFNLEWVPSFEKESSAYTKKYYNVLKQLSKSAKEVVIASVDYNEITPILKNNKFKLVKIGELVDSILDNKTDKEEIKVPSFDKSGILKWKKLKEAIRHKINEDLYEIKLNYGRTVKLTSSHNIFVLRNNKIRTMKTTDLKEGETILCPSLLPKQEEVIEKINLLKLSEVQNNKEIYLSGRDIAKIIRQRKENKIRTGSYFHENRIHLTRAARELIKITRLNKGYSTNSVSKLAGVSQPTISVWENGLKNPTYNNFANYLSLLNISPEVINNNQYCSIKESSFQNVLSNNYNNQYKEFSNLSRATTPLSKLTGEEIDQIKEAYMHGSKNRRNALPVELPITHQLARLWGYYLAEGDVNGDYRIRFSLGLQNYGHEEKIIKEIRQFCDLYNLNSNYYLHKKIKHQIITIDHCVMASLFKNILQFGENSTNKRIPEIVFNISSELKREFLRAYFLGDGSVSQRSICFNTASEKLASDLAYLLLQLGIIAGVSRSTHKTSKGGEIMWHVTISNTQDLQALKEIWKDHHRASIIKLSNKKKKSKEKIGDLIPLKIKSISKVQSSTPYVYDFSVEGENFIAGNGGICCHNTDFDVEGEVIGWNILRFICKKENAKRMKYSTLTKDELEKSFDNPLPNIYWGNAYAGEARHYLDWLYGINLSRALMSALKKVGTFKILSIGRVQGPALKIIVEREREISAFKPEPYWNVFANAQGIEFMHPTDIFDKKLLDKFRHVKEAIAETKTKEENILPPVPFDLTTLQREVYRYHRISPSQTLQIAQRLYLAGLISYPRTSSQKIPKEIEPKKILKNLAKRFSEVKEATRENPVEGKKADPAHPSIYPTGEYKKIPEQDEKIYNLIVKRFISAFSPDARVMNKKITLTGLENNKINEELKFTANGLKILERGWTKVYPSSMEERELPDINGKVKVDEIKNVEKETEPPKRYSPTSLITLLEKKNLGTKCLTADTKVILNDVEVAVEDLFRSGRKYRNEQDTEVREINVKTISLDGKKTEALVKNSNLISKRKKTENESIIRIETPTGAVKATEDHLIYIYDKSIEKKPISELKIGDKIVALTEHYKEGKSIFDLHQIKDNMHKIKGGNILHKFGGSKTGIKIENFPIKWSTSLAWILGYYYGDGSYSNPKYNGSHQLCFTTTEKKALSLLKENIKNVFGNEPYCYDLNGKYKVNCNSAMSAILIKIFPNLEGKNPITIPEEFIGDFLRGFFDADGNVHLRPEGKTKIKGINSNSFSTPRVKITLANEELIRWVSDLLNRLEIENHINKNISTLNGKKFDCWTILISGKEKVEKFAVEIGFDSYKEDILYKGLRCNSPHYEILRNSGRIYFNLKKGEFTPEDLAKENYLSRYNVMYAIKHLSKLGLVSKRRIGNRSKQKWVYWIKNKDLNYDRYYIKLLFEKIDKDIYAVPIESISKLNYEGNVYDISVDNDSPNFIIEGNMLVHNSTRSSIVDTLFDRGYLEGTSIKATDLGMKLIGALEKHSPIIIDENLTRTLEEEMEKIQLGTDDLEKKEKEIIEKAKKLITDISIDFKAKEEEIGKALMGGIENLRKAQQEANTLMPCHTCNKGNLRLMYSNKTKRSFVACSGYPNCTQTFSLPPNGFIKKTDKVCEFDKFPKLLSIRKGRKPWEFCFNPNCEIEKKKREEWRAKVAARATKSG